MRTRCTLSGERRLISTMTPEKRLPGFSGMSVVGIRSTSPTERRMRASSLLWSPRSDASRRWRLVAVWVTVCLAVALIRARPCRFAAPASYLDTGSTRLNPITQAVCFRVSEGLRQSLKLCDAGGSLPDKRKPPERISPAVPNWSLSGGRVRPSSPPSPPPR
ncbi:hypothetical protein BRAS3809_1140005 [Bradyrhizobium sp. STM 3809]|nr:hypothetical protein BRAS3809_1140005 [Bradyrhizobium sp. STM 3809]